MKILVIDDSKSSLSLISNVVREVDGTRVTACLDPREAMKLCQAEQFDLVLVDFMMPCMSGIEVTAALRASENYRLVPIIMITSEIERAVRLEAIAAGATDFLNKPFDPIELQARVRNLLALRQAQRNLADRADWLAREVEAATRHLVAREEEIIWRLARAIEYRDGATGEHVSRVAAFCRLIAEGLGQSEKFCRNIYLAAPLHDIGKIAVPDAILGKPGKLTPQEMDVMRQHVVVGASILENGSSDLIRAAEAIARFHHERWDGKGYPSGLQGPAIPLEARIAAVADVFDALCSERPYKPAWPVEKAYGEIVANSGTQFDPACVASFQLKWPQILDVVRRNEVKAA